jgi:hypothetical protein
VSGAPLVTICIPTRSAKRLPYLREAVASARAQTHTAVEILISDNGRDPEIGDFARAQTELDGRVAYRRNEEELELGGSFDAALQAARGEYAVLIGDDDRLLPEFARALVAARRPDTTVIFSNHYIIDSDGKRLAALTQHFTEHFGRAALAAGPVPEPAACAWGNSIPMSSALVRTAEAKRLGIRPDLRTPDVDLFTRLAAEGGSFVFVPEFLAEYRVHPLSQTAAGLASERLIQYLDPVAVPASVLPIKRRFMKDLVKTAVAAALRRGDADAARALMKRDDYPAFREEPFRVLAHRALALAPASVTRLSFGLWATMRRAQESRRTA